MTHTARIVVGFFLFTELIPFIFSFNSGFMLFSNQRFYIILFGFLSLIYPMALADFPATFCSFYILSFVLLSMCFFLHNLEDIFQLYQWIPKGLLRVNELADNVRPKQAWSVFTTGSFPSPEGPPPQRRRNLDFPRPHSWVDPQNSSWPMKCDRVTRVIPG